jgi:hypothetical protein
MGSPELTKMANFVDTGRVPEIDGAIADMAAAAIQDRAAPAWAPAGTTPHRGQRSGAPAARDGRRDRRDAVVAIAGIALTDRPAGGAIARLSAPARLTGPPTGAWAHSRHRKKRESHVRCHHY